MSARRAGTCDHSPDPQEPDPWSAPDVYARIARGDVIARRCEHCAALITIGHGGWRATD